MERAWNAPDGAKQRVRKGMMCERGWEKNDNQSRWVSKSYFL
jgi:hypothetical protein